MVPSGAKAKIEANFRAIALLQKLEDEGRNPTSEEKRTLLAYSGWGAFKDAFNDAKREEFESARNQWLDQEWQRSEAEFKQNRNQKRIERNGTEKPSYYELYAWNKRYGEVNRRLHDLMGQDEYDAARRSVLNAHYTTPEIIGKMWMLLERLGFNGGRVLEPSGGIGHYIGTQPAHLAERSEWSAVELDRITARILGKLYPQARVNSVSPNPSRTITGQGFEEAKIANNSMDLVISNVPFHEKGPWQSKKQFGIQFNLHNYFFARAIEKAKPGGLVAFITSSSTMENNARQRDMIASMGDLVTAIRLPNTAFKENAGTEVTTDIIIIRKPDGTPFAKQAWARQKTVGTDVVRLQWNRQTTTAASIIRSLDPEGQWKNAELEQARIRYEQARMAVKMIPPTRKSELPTARNAEADAYRVYVETMERKLSESDYKLYASLPIRVNEFFADHPENAFGKHSLQGSMYSANEYTLSQDDSGPGIPERFDALAESLPADIMGIGKPSEAAQVRDVESGDSRFSFVERDGQIYQVEADSLQPVDWSEKQKAVFRSWSPVKEAIRSLVAQETNPLATDQGLAERRTALNAAYDTHVRKFGPISKTGRAARHDHLMEDPDFPLTTALEDEVKEIAPNGKVTVRFVKSDIFTRRMNRPMVPPDSAETAEEALTASLAWVGHADKGYMGRLTGMDGDEVMAELESKGLVFLNPATGLHEIRDAYLSGHVQAKLDAAREAMEFDPAMRRNVEALEAALPPRKMIHEIGVNLGSAWIPARVVETYMTENLGLENVSVSFLESTNSWEVAGDGDSDQFSTDDVGTVQMLQHALDMSKPRITRRVGYGRSSRTEFDEAATMLAATRIDALKRDFDQWAKTSNAKLDGRSIQSVIEDEFNTRANGHVRPNFSGDHITLPGASDVVYRSPIRRSAIARMLHQGSGMIAHGVGFGKTFTLACLGMELKRLGKANRVMIGVENATLHQFAASFRSAYPTARLLIADERSFNQENRRRFVARIATGDFDCIVIAHSQLNLIPNSRDAIHNYIKQQIDELRALRSDVDSNDKRAVAALERAMISLENSRKKMLDDLASRQDVGIVWEDLGIDALLVDEAHRYKNAPLVTRMTDLKGVPTGNDSQRAIGMAIKSRSVQSKNGGRGVFFATGTPITNSMAEAYVMMRFTNPELLREQGIEHFDAFANLYGQTSTKVESTWKGKLESVTRFSKFVNGQSLMNLIGSAWDVQMDPTLAGIKRPKVEGDKSELVILPPGSANRAFNDWVTNTIADQWESQKYWQSIGGKKQAFDDNPWMQAIPIMTMQAGVAAALDIRLIDANAEDHPESKVNRMVDRVAEMHRSTSPYNGTQAIFCDLRNPFGLGRLVEFAGDPGLSEQGIGASESASFDLYKDIVGKLVAAGIPRNQIAIVGSEVSKDKRTDIFDNMNSGEIRVVIRPPHSDPGTAPWPPPWPRAPKAIS